MPPREAEAAVAIQVRRLEDGIRGFAASAALRSRDAPARTNYVSADEAGDSDQQSFGAMAGDEDYVTEEQFDEAYPDTEDVR